MALFPESDLSLYDDNDRAVRRHMEDFYQNAITVNQAFWYEADLDTRFEVGDQSVFNDIYNVPATRRKYFSFNRIRPIVHMITGYQRRNRKSTIVVPIENGDQETADQFTKLLVWAQQDQGMLETLSEAFHGACVTGLNLIQLWIDYRHDPINGNIKLDNCAYNTFLIDPYFRKADLSDCNAIWKRTFLSKKEIISLVPDKKDVIEDIYIQGARDGKFQFLPEEYNYEKTNLLSYDEYYYRSYRKQKLLVDTQTGNSYEWSSDNEERLGEYLGLYPQVTVVESEVPTVKLAILIEGKVVYEGPNPLGIDQYPFVPVFGYFNPQTPYYHWRIQGVVRGLRDAQFLLNRRKVIELDIAESQLTSGWIYKENALINPKDVFLTGQGKGLALKESAQMADVQQIRAPEIPSTFFQLSQSLKEEIQMISGVNEELMGSAIDDKAGILAMLRQGAGLTTLQRLFDQLDYAQKLLGKIMIKVIQNNFTPGKVRRILAQEPTQQFYNKTFGRYDAVVEEGFNTSTQRQLQFAQLLHLREVGVPVPDEILINSATVQNKKDITDVIAQQQQAQQQQEQQQQQAQQEQIRAQIEALDAQSQANRGLGIERASRVQENQQLAVERAAQAVENRAQASREQEQATLNFAKALREIETVDLQNFEKLITLSKLAKQLEQEDQQQMAIDQLRQAAIEQQMRNLQRGAPDM